jgi:hypothetical protein
MHEMNWTQSRIIMRNTEENQKRLYKALLSTGILMSDIEIHFQVISFPVNEIDERERKQGGPLKGKEVLRICR